MKPEDLFTPAQLEPFWRHEFGVIVDLRSEGLGVSYVSSHYTRSDAQLAATKTSALYPDAPVYVARRRVSTGPWDEVERVPDPAASASAPEVGS